MRKILCLLLISINDNLKINHETAFSFSISRLVVKIFIFQNSKLKLICDVIYTHAFEMLVLKNNFSNRNWQNL